MLSPSEFLGIIAKPEETLHRLAVVTSTSPLLVQMEGEEDARATPLARHAGYTPTLADRVHCVRIGATWLIEDKIV